MSRWVITEAYIKKSRKVQLSNRIKDSAPESLLGAVIAVVVFGSIWGLVEVTLGGFLYFVHFPLYKGGAITGGIGMALVATLVATYNRPSLVFWIGVLAALFKPLSALIYGQPYFPPHL
jgi:predicted membrane protein